MSTTGSPPPSPPSPPAPHLLRKNLGTMLPRHLPSWAHVVRHHAIRAADAYEIAVAADRVRPGQAEVGYRLYWMRQGFLASHDVPDDPDGYVVIGRHTCCDVVIDDERTVSLRHVLVRCTSTDDGLPVLHVLDLDTNEGFELSDATKQHSIAATGPLVFRIGIHAIVALPSTGGYPEHLPTPVVDREQERERKPAVGPNVVVESAAASPPRTPISRITLMPMSVDLSRRRSWTSGELAPRAVVPGGEPYLYEIALEPHENARRRAIVRFTGADLDHGVLIGRADKCVDDGLRAILSEAISRVHVLLVRDHGVCRLYDIASTNGTFASSRVPPSADGHASSRVPPTAGPHAGASRVRCVPLADDGTEVSLLRRGGAVIRWRALPTLQ
ncbi:MAG: FHA domain-containing protein [Deltaproteobacteria bacterium]|nr:FHA domain-containing protein [Deltaproteobacteria bacterium]